MSSSRDPSKKKRKLHIDPRIKALTLGAGIGWKLAGALALFGALLIIIGISSVSWLRIQPYTVRYQTGVLQGYAAKTQEYSLSRFGLYLTYFNGGTDIKPWSSRVNYVCGAYGELAAATATNGIVNIWSGACSANCVAHFKSRCSAYKQMASIGFVCLAFLIAAACIIIAASVWLYVFGKSVQFLETAYLGGGLVGLVVVSYWIWAANTQFRQLNVMSYYPAYQFGWSLWLTFTGCLLAIFAGIWVASLDYIDSHRIWKIKQQKIVENEVNAGAVTLPPQYAAPSYSQPQAYSPIVQAQPPPMMQAQSPVMQMQSPVAQAQPPPMLQSPVMQVQPQSPVQVPIVQAHSQYTALPPPSAPAHISSTPYTIGLPEMAFGYHATGVAPSVGHIMTGSPRGPTVGQFQSPIAPPPPMGNIRYT